jgi:hypothetical protein
MSNSVTLEMRDISQSPSITPSNHNSTEVVPIFDETPNLRKPPPKKIIHSHEKKEESPNDFYFAIVVLVVNAALFVVGMIVIGVSIYELAFATQASMAHNAKKVSYVAWE